MKMSDIGNDCISLLSERLEKVENLRNATILITGGTGFLGSWLCEMIYTLNQNFDMGITLYLISRERDAYNEKLGHLHNEKFIFLRNDVKNIIEIPKDVNFIIHAAAVPDNRFHTSNPMKTMIDIAEGTRALLKAADRLPDLRMFLNVSSGTVYGANDENLLKISEETCSNPALGSISSAYSEAKRYAETLVTAARSEMRLPVVSIRPFAFIGPYQPLSAPWAVNNFMQDAIKKRPIRVLGNGETVRSLLYGGDFALWVLTIVCNAKSGAVYNVGSDHRIRLDDLAELVSSKFNPKPEIIYNASLVGSVPKTIIVPDINKAKEDFDLEVYTSIEAALKKTIHWYEQER